MSASWPLAPASRVRRAVVGIAWSASIAGAVVLLISGPLYALLAARWTKPIVDSGTYGVIYWAGALLSYPGVALIAGWVPLLFPNGSLPGPRWRLPAVVIVGVGTAGLVAVAVRPGIIGPGIISSIAIEPWPPVLRLFADAVPIALLALFILAVAGLVTRYRRGDQVERLQAIVDRRFHRARYDAERTVAGFVGRLRNQLDLGAVTGELQTTASAAIEPTSAAVWLREGGGAAR